MWLILFMSWLALPVLANNGNLVSPASNPAVVFIPSPSACTGSVIDGGRAVLTAGHCVLRRSSDGIVFFSKPAIVIEGHTVIAAGPPRVHPDYRALVEGRGTDPAGNERDLAVIPLPSDFPAPRGLELATGRPSIGDEVEVIGWGKVMPDGDWDSDGVPNNQDPCPLEPFRPGAAGASAPGCGPEASPIDLSPGLRAGSNRVALTTDRLIVIDRPIALGMSHWNDGTTPGSGDSGGPLLDRAGEIVGVVKGGRTTFRAGVRAHEAYYIDVNESGNRAFLDDLP